MLGAGAIGTIIGAYVICGAQNIQWCLTQLAVTPLPSVRTHADCLR